jgi:16S rRNA (guanine527-N7)-methyltransferase
MSGNEISAEQVAARCAAVGPLDANEAASLAAYLNLLKRWNRTFNLTAILEPAAMIERHLVESLSLRGWLQGDSIADVGSGAGIPGLPLAMVERARRFTLIESRAKRVRFLRQAAAELGLSNAIVSHGRVEDLRSPPPFDTVLARAVAPPPDLLPMITHLTRPGSRVLVLAGKSASPALPAGSPFVGRIVKAGPSVHGVLLCFDRTGA